jgi:excisionase family DNA binding protein
MPTKVLTVKEAADYLRIHTSTIYRLLKRKQLPAFRVGSDWRFNVEDIDRWRLGDTNPSLDSRGPERVQEEHAGHLRR